MKLDYSFLPFQARGRARQQQIEDTMKLRILSCDVPLQHGQFEKNSFWNSDAFSDYDIVITDPQKVSHPWEDLEPDIYGRRKMVMGRDRGVGQEISEFMDRRSCEIEMLFEKTGGILVCLLREKGPVLERHRLGSLHSFENLDRYSWIPKSFLEKESKEGNQEFFFQGLSYSVISRHGKSIGEVNLKHPFSQYFEAFSGKIHFEVVVDLGDVEQFSTIIARNKAKEVISFELPIAQGRMVCVPPALITSSEDQKKLAGVILSSVSSLMRLPVSANRALWLNKYTLPGENNHEEDILNLAERIQKLESKKKQFKARQGAIKSLKGILDLSGKHQLEPLVREVFRRLGFNVLDPKDYDEPYDLWMRYGEKCVIGEIEGTTGQVDVQKFRQLLGYVTERQTQKNEQCEGILVANGDADEDPSTRGEQFTAEAIRGCESQKYCRITTWQLFRALKAVLASLSKDSLKKRICEEIIACNDEFVFRDS